MSNCKEKDWQSAHSRSLEDVLRGLLGDLSCNYLELVDLGTAQLPAERAEVVRRLLWRLNAHNDECALGHAPVDGHLREYSKRSR